MLTGVRIIVLGRQGSGKGTQCSLLAPALGVAHVSTGDLFRQEVADDTPLGRQVAGVLESGRLVPDEVVLEVVGHRLAGAGGRDGFLLDGFPRTLAQGVALFDLLGAGRIDAAVEIGIPDAMVIPRLLARRVCQGCGTITSVGIDGPETAACMVCGGVLARRDDDTEDAIRHRLAVYEEQTGPLLLWLHSRGLLLTVDGQGTPGQIHQRVMRAVRDQLAAATRQRDPNLVRSVDLNSGANGSNGNGHRPAATSAPSPAPSPTATSGLADAG